MTAFLSILVFFLPLILVFAFFVVFLVLYLVAKKKLERDPESVSPGRLSTLRVLLIIASVMFGLLIVSAAVLIIMVYFAIAYM